MDKNVKLISVDKKMFFFWHFWPKFGTLKISLLPWKTVKNGPSSEAREKVIFFFFFSLTCFNYIFYWQVLLTPSVHDIINEKPPQYKVYIHCTITKWFPPPQNHPTLECTLVLGSWIFLCRFQNGMAWYGNFFYQCNMSFLEKKIKRHLGWFAQVKFGTNKYIKKLGLKFHIHDPAL